MGRLIKKVNLYIIEVLVQLMDYIISGCLGSTVVALLSFVVLEEMLCSWQIIFLEYSKLAPIWNKGVLVICLQATINIKESSHRKNESIFICRTLVRNKHKRCRYLY